MGLNMDYNIHQANKHWWLGTTFVIATYICISLYLKAPIDVIVTFVVVYFLTTFFIFKSRITIYLAERARRKALEQSRRPTDDLTEAVLSYILAYPKRNHIVIHLKVSTRIRLQDQIPRGVRVTYWPIGLALTGWRNNEDSVSLSCTCTLRKLADYVQLVHRLRGSNPYYMVQGYFSVPMLEQTVHCILFKPGQKHHVYKNA